MLLASRVPIGRVGLIDRYRRGHEHDEDESREHEPAAVDIHDSRAVAEALHGASLAGRGSDTVLGRALARLQSEHGNAAIGRALTSRAPAKPGRAANLALSRQLIASGTDADFESFRTLAEPASGFLLGRDAATNVVTAVGSRADPATSPAFAGLLTAIMEDPAQNAEVNFGTGQPGVVIGAFPTPADLTGGLVQRVDMDDILAIEAGAPGHGVAFLAHELQENYVAHAAVPVAGVNQFPAAHEQANVAQSAVIADLAGTGPRVAERVAVVPVSPTTLIAVVDFETDFLVLEIRQAPGTADFEITDSRQAGRVNVSDQTLDGFATGSDAPPGGGQVATAAADLVAHPQATAIVEGFTDDVGAAAVNDPLSQRRAERTRAAIIAAAPGLTQDNIHVAGRGATSFVAPNVTEADRRRNRRVRIRVEEPSR